MTMKLVFPKNASAQKELRHSFEPSVDLNDIYDESSFSIPASTRSTRITLRTAIDLSSARRGVSDSYLASIRRVKCGEISRLLSELGNQAKREDFYMATFPILDALMKLIKQLQPSAGEANAREVLRQLRDTFLDNNQEHYKLENVREVLAELLAKLSKLDKVSLDFIDSCASAIEQLGFSTTGLKILSEE